MMFIRIMNGERKPKLQAPLLWPHHVSAAEAEGREQCELEQRRLDWQSKGCSRSERGQRGRGWCRQGGKRSHRRLW